MAHAWRQVAWFWLATIGLVGIFCGWGHAASAPAAPSSPPAAATAAAQSTPVELRLMNRPVATLRGTLGGAGPATRAERAEATFDSLSESELGLPLSQLSGTLGDVSGVAFRLGDRVLFALVEGDLDPTDGLTMEAAAAQTRARLQAVIDARRAQLYWPNLLRGALFSLGSLALLVGLIWGIGRARSRMRAALQRALDVHLQQRSGSQFDWTGAVYQLVSRIVQILAVGSVIALGFLWLQFALEQFPLTEPLGDRMGAFILGLLRQIGVSIVESIPGWSRWWSSC
ncbi:cytochrome P450 [Cupriavidus campinensis]|uniref:Cytochrome P450 n=1 Tax=Cupriavidus campinensis TaxID=151783 RepID=A0AAE9L3T4_9BURK|nr:cytochrome P450 [Cupriavidus campinensis]URF06253.1 cytochrome P450 [Cupriavidus campinensis]